MTKDLDALATSDYGLKIRNTFNFILKITVSDLLPSET
jgi:hypothetical protein